MLTDTGDYAGALEASARVMEFEPGIARDHFVKGWLDDEIGQLESALAEFAEALRIDPNYAHAYAVRAVTHAKLKNYPAAISDSTEALAIDPDLAEAAANRGVSYYLTGRPELALGDLEYALDLGYDSGTLRHFLGRVFADGLDFDRAISEYDRSIELFAEQRDPLESDTWANRGIARYHLGQLDAATNDLTQAISLGHRGRSGLPHQRTCVRRQR